MVTITFHGHACFTLEADGRRVVVDPFLTGNPMHYNTFDVIRADPEDFKRQVGGRAQVVVLRPGQAHTLS